MATSKLLKPTNVTISIPEFTDQPDQRVNSNCIDKEADAINTLSEQIGKFKLPLTTKTTKKSFSGASASSSTFTLSNDTMVTVTAYNGGAVNIYSPSGTTETAICGAYAPSGWSQSSCGNSVYCKAGTYSVYYYGQSSSSSGSVIEWS